MFMFTSMALGARTGMVTGSRGRSVLEQFSKPAPAAPGAKPVVPAPAAPVVPAVPAPPAPAPPSPANQ